MGKNEILYALVGVLFDDEGKVILTLRKDDEISEADNKWELPGGAVEFGESATDCLIREFKEETGLFVQVEKLIDFIWSNVWDNQKRKIKQQVIVLPFLCSLRGGEIQVSDPEIAEARWFYPEEVSQIETLPGIKEIVSYSLKYRKIKKKKEDIFNVK